MIVNDIEKWIIIPDMLLSYGMKSGSGRRREECQNDRR